MSDGSNVNSEREDLEMMGDLSNYEEIIDTEEICDLKFYKGRVPEDESIKEVKIDSKINLDRNNDGKFIKEFKLIGKLINKLIIEDKDGNGAVGIILIHKVSITLKNSLKEPQIGMVK